MFKPCRERRKHRPHNLLHHEGKTRNSYLLLYHNRTVSRAINRVTKKPKIVRISQKIGLDWQITPTIIKLQIMKWHRKPTQNSRCTIKQQTGLWGYWAIITPAQSQNDENASINDKKTATKRDEP